MITAAANGITLVAYSAISFAIGRGLWRSGQWRSNRLGVATAAIFITCAVHHGSHTVHMVLPAFGLEVEAGLAMREALGHDYHIAAWDVLTAGVGVWYWGLRGRFPALVKGAAIFDDLKVRESAERTLAASEERYRRMVEVASEGVLTTDRDDRISYLNQRLAEIVGRSPEDLAGCPVTDLVAPGDRQEFERHLARGRTGHPERFDTQLSHPSGQDVWAQVSATPLHDLHGEHEGSLALVTDVTEQKTLEHRVRQSQKLEAVGQLAAGVAHDFNNMLTVIDSYAAMLLEEVDEPLRQDVAAIRAAAERAHNLTRQLLVLSRAQVTRPRVLNLNDVVVGIEEMLRRLITADIELVVRATARLATVHVDQGQIEQVLVNLVVNARDAMPTGGRLAIETSHAAGDGDGEHQSGEPWAGPGRYVTIAVSDTGSGMTADVRARIFEPFFTTKAPGKGTGLGLATTYGIVSEAGGSVTVQSEPGRGTTFQIHLPLATLPQPNPVSPPTQPNPDVAGRVVPGRGETILLAEDDPAVRALAERILGEAGYRVLAAVDGSQALQIADRTAHFDMLLTDVVMPRMNGRELAEELARRRPGVRVLFTSAYTRGIIAERGILDHSVTYLEKPYTPARLTAAVRGILDTPIGARQPDIQLTGRSGR